MINTNITVKGNTMTITVDVSDKSIAAAQPSSSGKTKVVASTQGNTAVALPNGQTMMVGLNAYVK